MIKIFRGVYESDVVRQANQEIKWQGSRGFTVQQITTVMNANYFVLTVLFKEQGENKIGSSEA